jgi:hypothetical protein
MQTRVQGEIQRLKVASSNSTRVLLFSCRQDEISDLYSEMFAYQVQLLDPGLVSRNLLFTGFVATWIVRLVDPIRQHPSKMIE